MAATSEPGAGSTQIQQLTWTLGEARLRLEDIGPVPAAEHPPAGTGGPDFFTEWQAAEPS